jgi:hypothetical protein
MAVAAHTRTHRSDQNIAQEPLNPEQAYQKADCLHSARSSAVRQAKIDEGKRVRYIIENFHLAYDVKLEQSKDEKHVLSVTRSKEALHERGDWRSGKP